MTFINSNSYPKSIANNLLNSIFVSMKNAYGIKKISVRVNEKELLVYTTLAEKSVGYRKLLADHGLVVYLQADGTTIELFGPGSVYPEYLFSGSDSVVSYRVSDIETVVSELERTGAKTLSPIQRGTSGYRFCHLAIDGKAVFGVFENA